MADNKDDEIKTTYLNSTRAQRRLWVHLMSREAERTGEKLKLSDWIIRHLPQPGIDLTEFVDSRREYLPDELPEEWREFADFGARHFIYMDSVIISEQSDGSFIFTESGIDHVSDEIEHLEVMAFKWYLG